ncbi:DinB family protein [Gillisia sp. Hel_I_29]|uniref:DinB family protein n=1 Tax=Gillisia sp. Hel_I_29 TaxID=1249975 RepID=UPI00068D9CC9|nr:DinB family protein [Gillisia sp. Hel_I_29]
MKDQNIKSEKPQQKPEVWLRGPVQGIPNLLQPAAHALLQAGEDMHSYADNFPKELLWRKPAGRASVGFHLQHLTGVLDRMLTYAKKENLSDLQFEHLKNEGAENPEISTIQLLQDFDNKVSEALQYFKTVDADTLTEERSVGRKKMPSTHLGLLFHAAEHSQRHIGQMLVTISILKERS